MRLPIAFALVLLLLLAGCSSPGADPASAPVGDGEATALAPTTAMVAFEGDTGQAECVHGLPATAGCINSSPNAGPLGQGERLYVDPSTDGLLSAALSVEWTARVPAMPDLRAEWGVYTGCPDDCQLVLGIGDATGPSPLTIEVQGLDLADGEQLGVYVRASQRLPGADVEATAGQSFSISGETSFLPAGDDAMAGASASA